MSKLPTPPAAPRFDYPELRRARADMEQQDALYRPTSFWRDASQVIVDELQAAGIERFRALDSTLGYFVPTYGLPGNSFEPAMAAGLAAALRQGWPDARKPQLALGQFLSGQMAALADYRVLMAADDPAALPHLHTFSESAYGAPVEQFEFDGRRFSRSSLNYLLGLAMLKKHLKGAAVPATVMEIGGGFGTLGEILLSSGMPGLRYLDIDIPPTSFVAQAYLGQLVGAHQLATYESTRERATIEIGSLPAVSVLTSWQIEKLQGKVDLFVNFISFQEMEPHVVQNYLAHVARLQTEWVLLRNMREGKNIRTAEVAGVETPIRAGDYADMLTGYELVESSVIPFGYRTVDDFNSELYLFRRKHA
jgi:putative sugar O-methyltransferase